MSILISPDSYDQDTLRGMTPQKKKQIVVVLGMHRSGTSALTKSLELLGVGLGNTLLPAAAENPKGFWEDKDCLAINEEILTDNGIRWCDLSTLQGLNPAPTNIESLTSRACELLKARVADTALWGFKDPRTCRTLPFWKTVFQKLDYEPLYVISIRNPLNVSESLVKRDALLKSHSLLLWAEHTLMALAHTEGAKRVVVDYDLLITEPMKEVTRMATVLGLNAINPEDSTAKEYCDNFLEEGLRHNAHSIDTLFKDTETPDCIKELYLQLRNVAEDHIALSDSKIQESIKKSALELGVSPFLMKIFNSFVKTGVLVSTVGTELSTKSEEDIVPSIQSLKSRLIAAEAELEECRTLSADLARQIELKIELNNQYKNIIADIFASKSWKITEPLRRLAHYSKALVRR